jgi:hypothetical protein
MRLRGGAVIAIGLATLAIAATAQAAQRYAAPSGSGPKAECPQASPCSLKDAMEGAGVNDEVIVTSGAYFLPETIFAEAEGLSVHGDPAGPMPTISAKITGYAMQVSGSGSVISYLDLTDTAEYGNALSCLATRVERMRLTGIGKGAYGMYQGPGCVVRDSLVLASGEGATALYIVGTNDTSNLTRNVTAVARGPDSVGISAYNQDIFSTSGVHKVDLKNSIAQGERVDLLAKSSLEFPSEILVSNSNFDRAAAEGSSRVVDLGANQTAQPLFANAAGGDYREAAGSPTIDAGVADQLGTLDLAGNTRILGAAPDIGAFEIAPLPVVPLAAGQIQSLSATPHKFRAANIGGAVVSAKKKAKAPIGTTVSYSLSAAATVTFSVERRLPGRKVGKRCVKQTRANRTKKKCARFKPVKGSFTHSGQAGQNRFKFSGRIAGKGLGPGRYRLVGKTGSASKTASFRIVK